MQIGKLNKADEEMLRSGECPICGSEKFWKGPRGGAALNIMCEKGHKFWVAGPFTPEYLGQERVKVEDDKLVRLDL